MSSATLPPFEIAHLLAEAVEAAANGILITDRAGTMIWANAAFSKMTGYLKEEVLGQHSRILKSGLHDAAFYRHLWETVNAGQVWQGTMCNRRKDGSTYAENMTITPVRDAAGEISHFIAIKQDISEKSRLEEHHTRLVGTLEDTPDFVGISDASYRPLFVNRAGRRMVGCPEQEDLSGTHIDAFHPEWAMKVVMDEGIPAALRTGAWMGESALLTRSGREIPVSQAIMAHRGTDGAVRFFSTIMRDLTEQRKLEAQLHQSQKMEAVGQLAGGVAHDFNNLLTVINGFSEMVARSFAPEDPNRRMLQEVQKAGERAAALTRQLLAFSRKQVLEPKVLDLNVVVKDFEKMLRRLIGEDVVLWTVLGPGAWSVKVDPGQMEQVIMNLAVNARDAMPQGGKLTIETANIELDGAFAQMHPEVKPGRYFMLTMTDTGCGMPPDIQARIFEPFFTTKGPAKGTGLGLATVYGIIKQSGGFIYVSSEPGHGTKFTIYFPAIDGAEAMAQALHGPKKKQHGTETILLVEDEDAVRSVSRFVLQTLGYKVLDAARPTEAIRLCDQHSGTIDLLVTDIVMPEMGGRTLTDRICELRPGIKVLYLSGYTDDAVVRHGVMRAEVAFLQKPFTPSSLSNKVREVLDGTR